MTNLRNLRSSIQDPEEPNRDLRSAGNLSPGNIWVGWHSLQCTSFLNVRTFHLVSSSYYKYKDLFTHYLTLSKDHVLCALRQLFRSLGNKYIELARFTPFADAYQTWVGGQYDGSFSFLYTCRSSCYPSLPVTGY